MKLKYRFAAGLLLAGTLAGCHRDPDSDDSLHYDLTGRYTAGTTITAAHPIALYTKDGQVSNQAVVSRFLARRPSLSQQGYFSATDVPRGGTSTTTLTFRANNRATLLSTSPTYTDSLRFEVTNREASSFLLQQLDSITLFSGAGGQLSCGHANDLIPFVRGTDWGRKCRAVPPATGYSQQCRVRLVRVVGASGSQLYIPYYSWLVESGGCTSAVGGDWNTFNPGIVSRLVAGDTVVVQEREVTLSR